MAVQKGKNFNQGGGGGNGGPGAAHANLQTAEAYLLGQQNVGQATSASSYIQPPAQQYAPDAGTQQTAWDLPSLGSLQINTGIPTSKAVSANTRTAVSSGVEMLNIYDKLDSGQALTQADLNAASKLGGDIERAAQLSAKGGKLPKNAQSAVTKAQNEIATRLHSTVGLPPTALGKEGLNAKVPPSFAATMQNAGYAVTKNMTVKQALGAAQSVVGGGAPPTAVQGDMTVSQYITSLASMSKTQITQLQQQLYNNGFYDSTYYGGTDTDKGADTKEYTQGVLDTGTILAFRKAILQTLVDQKQGKGTTLDQTINGGASTNPALGNVPITGGTSGAAGTTGTVEMATNAQTQQPLISAFVSALGRNPSQTELNAFTSTYQNELEQGNKTLAEQGLSPDGEVDYTTGIPFIQGTPTVSAAATNYAENTDSTEYQAHNVADAFGMLMNLVDRQGTSSLDTLGTRPGITS